MSIACGLPLLECVYCLACTRWAWKRCIHNAGHESETWGLATIEEFEPVPRICRYILGNYEDDLDHPQWEPPTGYGMIPQWVVCRRTYEDTLGRVTPYLLYVDHNHADIVLAIRGLNMAKESDYAMLLDNRLGKRKFDGGYVHNGLLKAAAWVLDAECETFKELLVKHSSYTLTFAGHSLGSGVAAILAMLVVQNRHKLGDVDRKRVRCYAIAPARCMSLNLAVRYADVINSVVLQDDFLPRTATPLEDVFKSLFCLPCLLCLRCMRDTCIPEHVMLRDPRRLYAPGRLYHIVERKPFRCGRFPPVVKTAVPVDGRFEHIVLSCNATSDHAIIWIERECQRALDVFALQLLNRATAVMNYLIPTQLSAFDIHLFVKSELDERCKVKLDTSTIKLNFNQLCWLMFEKERTMEIPSSQRMERKESLAKEHVEEHRAALRRAVTLSVPDAYLPSPYGTFESNSSHSSEDSLTSSSKTQHRMTWDEFIVAVAVFEKDESSQTIIRKTVSYD